MNTQSPRRAPAGVAPRALLAAATLIAAAAFPGWATAAPITKSVNINVYQVCNDDGSSCASQGPAGNFYYVAETNKIWAQAGIGVSFTFSSKVFSTQYFDLDDVPGDSFDDLYQSVLGHGPSATTVDMFLVNSFAGAYGVGYYGFGGLIMSMADIIGFDCGGALGCTGRVDTLAHELGHNLGLTAVTDPDHNAADPSHSTDPNNLMAGGSYRNVPTALSDINPSGLGLDKLSQFQSDFARNSTLLRDVSAVPEPGSFALVGLALLALGALSPRRAPAKSARA